MSTATQPPKHKRRWYQFSLKTLLVVMFLYAVLLFVGLLPHALLLLFIYAVGWIRYRQQQARENREREAADVRSAHKAIEEVAEEVAAFEKLGGFVMPMYEVLRPQTWLEEQFDDPGDADDPVGDWVTGASAGGGWTGAASIDTGLEHLKALTELQSLNLDGTNVTDAGLEHLTGLTELYVLSLRNTNVTEDGLNKLRLALPNCDIRHQWRTDDPQNLREFSPSRFLRSPLAE